MHCLSLLLSLKDVKRWVTFFLLDMLGVMYLII